VNLSPETPQFPSNPLACLALALSLLALMQQKSAAENFAYAHPLFWAPYALVGEGGI
jgi:CHAT domain-containing protein